MPERLFQTSFNHTDELLSGSLEDGATLGIVLQADLIQSQLDVLIELCGPSPITTIHEQVDFFQPPKDKKYTR